MMNSFERKTSYGFGDTTGQAAGWRGSERNRGDEMRRRNVRGNSRCETVGEANAC
jgi:hypothetical protein